MEVEGAMSAPNHHWQQVTSRLLPAAFADPQTNREVTSTTRFALNT